MRFIRTIAGKGLEAVRRRSTLLDVARRCSMFARRCSTLLDVCSTLCSTLLDVARRCSTFARRLFCTSCQKVTTYERFFFSGPRSPVSTKTGCDEQFWDKQPLRDSDFKLPPVNQPVMRLRHIYAVWQAPEHPGTCAARVVFDSHAGGLPLGALCPSLSLSLSLSLSISIHINIHTYLYTSLSLYVSLYLSLSLEPGELADTQSWLNKQCLLR